MSFLAVTVRVWAWTGHHDAVAQGAPKGRSAHSWISFKVRCETPFRFLEGQDAR